MAIKISNVSWINLLVLISLSFSTLLFRVIGALEDDRKTYIVYMGEAPKGVDISASSSFQMSMLHDVLGSNASSMSLLYSYKRSFSGFAVNLTEKEMQKMAATEGVVSVFPNEKYELHTTRSWDFMGFSEQVNRTAVESDIIVGVLDTGIWPESESFKDTGFGPPPATWNGSCEISNFTCNNKIIGARHYNFLGSYIPDDLRSARDSNGHGTHTASTAAGGLVGTANLMGLGLGTARGAVPSARIAVYKVCWSHGCYGTDILAAFDDAIADGVDIISLSVGASYASDYFVDPIAIGAFHAMKKGILTSNSAGNNGPDIGSISNVSPWSLSVAASSIDRKFIAKVELGNNLVYEGVSVNTFDLKNNMYPMIYGGAAPNASANYTSFFSRYCLSGSLDMDLVRGKIVLCDALSNGEVPLLAGAHGTVMRGGSQRDIAFSFPLPATYIGLEDGEDVFNYINTTSKPTATIWKSNEVKDALAPYVPAFSSRGPNTITPDILKPDITAPGVDILAAWSLVATVTELKTDKRRVAYNIISGTSMACPHATSVAAYIKSFHPSWSPAAIKSALMTTAYPLDIVTSPEAEFAYGAGHINPLKSVNPGLVYDADVPDYINFLCGQGYDTAKLYLITGENITCSDSSKEAAASDLNLPSIALSTEPLKPFSRNYTRTVTNVGFSTSTYKATISAPPALSIKVEPTVLSFTSIGEKLSFMVKVEGVIGRTLLSAALVWDDGTHQVRTPIAVFSSSST